MCANCESVTHTLDKREYPILTGQIQTTESDNYYPNTPKLNNCIANISHESLNIVYILIHFYYLVYSANNLNVQIQICLR